MDQTSDPVLSGLTYYVCSTRFSLECGILYSGNLVNNPILAFGKFYIWQIVQNYDAITTLINK